MRAMASFINAYVHVFAPFESAQISPLVVEKLRLQQICFVILPVFADVVPLFGGPGILEMSA